MIRYNKGHLNFQLISKSFPKILFNRTTKRPTNFLFSMNYCFIKPVLLSTHKYILSFSIHTSTSTTTLHTPICSLLPTTYLLNKAIRSSMLGWSQNHVYHNSTSYSNKLSFKLCPNKSSFSSSPNFLTILEPKSKQLFILVPAYNSFFRQESSRNF